jgi:hypothetical protein
VANGSKGAMCSRFATYQSHSWLAFSAALMSQCPLPLAEPSTDQPWPWFYRVGSGLGNGSGSLALESIGTGA